MPLVTGSTNGNRLGQVFQPEVDKRLPEVPYNQNKAVDGVLDTVRVDQTWAPIKSMIKHRLGSSWSVKEYYSKILTKDSEVGGASPTVDATFESFKCIKNVEFRVTTPLSQNFDERTKTNTYAGTSTVFGIIPNAGDMFIADTGEGDETLFQITASSQKSLQRETLYEITYGEDTQSALKIANLRQKVVETLHYVVDFLNYGQNPILTSDDYQALVRLSGDVEYWTGVYIRLFFSREFSTLLVPEQLRRVYDPYLVAFFKQVPQFSQRAENVWTREYSTSADDRFGMKCIWDAILMRDVREIDFGFKRATTINPMVWNAQAGMAGLAHGGFDAVLYSIDGIDAIDSQGRQSPDYVGSCRELTSPRAIPVPTLSNLPPNNPIYPGPGADLGLVDPDLVIDDELNPTPDGSDPYALPNVHALERFRMGCRVRNPNYRRLCNLTIHPVTIDNFYVFSEHFYERDSEQSALENVVNRWLDGERINAKLLLDISLTMTHWGRLEQFYYMPVMIYLMIAALRGI